MKLYIRAMSVPRDKAIRQASSFATEVVEHLIKILVYADIRKNYVPHWIDEISTWFHEVDGITVKPGAKKLKARDLEYSLFSSMGDEISDYRRELVIFSHNNKNGKFNYEDKESYPEFEVTLNLAEQLMDCCYDIIKETTPLLTDKLDHSKDEYKQVINDIIERYI